MVNVLKKQIDTGAMESSVKIFFSLQMLVSHE